MAVAVAMSGGVDSSVAAALLLEAGERLFGMTMVLGGEAAAPEVQSAEASAVASAREVCRVLGIDHHVVELSDLFVEKVLRPSWDEYDRGRTPNPCALCNPCIKFGALFEGARSLGARALATGHYARRADADEGTDPILCRARDRNKDQSYFLFALTSEQLGRAAFPNGSMTKAEVRDRARALGLPSSERAESQDVCPAACGQQGRGFAETLRRRFGALARPGDICTASGQVVGRHAGIHAFTIGQRKGLGMALGQRAYVVALDAARDRVVVGEAEDLLAPGLTATRTSLRSAPEPSSGLPCLAQIRSRHAPAPALAHVDRQGRLKVRFDEPQSAVTPGQAVVLYRDDEVLGGGWIDEAWPRL